jgi:hypothetical protein
MKSYVVSRLASAWKNERVTVTMLKCDFDTSVQYIPLPLPRFIPSLKEGTYPAGVIPVTLENAQKKSTSSLWGFFAGVRRCFRLLFYFSFLDILYMIWSRTRAMGRNIKNALAYAQQDVLAYHINKTHHICREPWHTSPDASHQTDEPPWWIWIPPWSLDPTYSTWESSRRRSSASSAFEQELRCRNDFFYNCVYIIIGTFALLSWRYLPQNWLLVRILKQTIEPNCYLRWRHLPKKNRK